MSIHFEETTQLNTFPRPKLLAAAVSLAVFQVGSAYAQQATEQGNNAADGLKLDSVVVTATTTKVSKMKQSVSVSGLDSEQIQRSAPTSAAEVFRAIPGIKSESSSGEGNANISVRGVPLSAGGARYLSIQENGLPILTSGEVAFGTSDQFLRVDGNLDGLEAVRGGSGSTLSTNSPGGVINFLDKTGEIQGGMVSFTTGLDHTNFRTDFSLGKALSDDTRMHVGGFFRTGEIPRDIDYKSDEGGQLKLNVTKDVKNGYVRAYVKLLNDRTAPLFPVPTVVVNNTITPIAGIDPRTAFLVSRSWGQDVVKNENGQKYGTSVEEGLHVKSNSIGFEGNFDLANGFNVNNKFRTSDNSARFIGLLPISTLSNAPAGSTYATGSKAGTAYNGQVFSGLLFNTDVRDLGNTVNDLKLSKSFSLVEGSKTTAIGGLFYAKQANSQVWNWNIYSVAANGTDPQLINKPGNVANGTVEAADIAYRAWDVDYTTTSPYIGLTHEQGPWTLDGSVRFDRQDAKGYANSKVGANGGLDPAGRIPVDYKQSETGYSVGANYQLEKNQAVFARMSEGYTFPQDRELFSGVNDLRNGGTIALYQVKQQELGYKFRSGGLSVFTTFFMADTQESNFDITKRNASGGLGLFSQTDYESRGLEVETAYRSGNFKLAGGVTYTDAEIASGADAGKRPKRQPKFSFQVSPSYTMGDHSFGVSVIGVGDSYQENANIVTMEGYTTLNAFYDYKWDNKTSILLSANNLTNEIGFTEAEDNVRARSINGRSVKATLKYAF